MILEEPLNILALASSSPTTSCPALEAQEAGSPLLIFTPSLADRRPMIHSNPLFSDSINNSSDGKLLTFQEAGAETPEQCARTGRVSSYVHPIPEDGESDQNLKAHHAEHNSESSLSHRLMRRKTWHVERLLPYHLACEMSSPESTHMTPSHDTHHIMLQHENVNDVNEFCTPRDDCTEPDPDASLFGGMWPTELEALLSQHATLSRGSEYREGMHGPGNGHQGSHLNAILLSREVSVSHSMLQRQRTELYKSMAEHRLKEASVAVREQQLEEFKGQLQSKEKVFRDAQAGLDEVSRRLEAKEAWLRHKQAELEEKEMQALMREEELDTRESKACSREEMLDTRESQACCREEMLDARELQACSREEMLDARESKACSREEMLDARELQACSREEMLDARESKACSREEMLDARESQACCREDMLDARDLQACSREEMLDARESKACSREEMLDARESQACCREEDLARRRLARDEAKLEGRPAQVVLEASSKPGSILQEVGTSSIRDYDDLAERIMDSSRDKALLQVAREAAAVATSTTLLLLSSHFSTSHASIAPCCSHDLLASQPPLTDETHDDNNYRLDTEDVPGARTTVTKEEIVHPVRVSTAMVEVTVHPVRARTVMREESVHPEGDVVADPARLLEGAWFGVGGY
ncbi:hypothetical protein CEUSTIGMA_g1100.t1 [Chlamydomonas eustigma]|uniref:Galaxin-like repeats domain-containing protein n=1 Tax=Chlamydomonas eustigma TaxID=1157962 RepID=A0A250WSH9_9CHLO|nr:hypothetical protein CEUSTIGMA_g1100.t1 [Chlamydomonas eustigma]|eukprot:GAX73649.1 hypothetical protein CEUSTIGMA_g1100.t1 [Chlamydomonas eustigma]